FGQMWCGRRGLRHCGHGSSSIAPSARCERRRPLRPLESLTFGSAMSARDCTETEEDDSSPPPRPSPAGGEGGREEDDSSPHPDPPPPRGREDLGAGLL